jgi:hypothetical protein
MNFDFNMVWFFLPSPSVPKNIGREAVTRLSLVGEVLPSCHVDKGDIFSRQLNKENQDTSVVGMTAVRDAETCAELD